MKDDQSEKQTSSVDEKLANALNIALPSIEEKKDSELSEEEKNAIIEMQRRITQEIKKSSETKADTDFDLVRSALQRLAIRGETAFEDALRVAAESESPRAYEVVSQLLKTTIDANKDLLDIHKRKKEIEAKDPIREQPSYNQTNIENIVFQGTPADLQRQLKKVINEKGDDESTTE